MKIFSFKYIIFLILSSLILVSQQCSSTGKWPKLGWELNCIQNLEKTNCDEKSVKISKFMG